MIVIVFLDEGSESACTVRVDDGAEHQQISNSVQGTLLCEMPRPLHFNGPTRQPRPGNHQLADTDQGSRILGHLAFSGGGCARFGRVHGKKISSWGKDMIRAIYRLSGTAGLVLLSACAEPADRQAMVPASINAVRSTSSYSGAVGQVIGGGGDATDPMWTSEISSEDFKAALEASLVRAGIFSERGPLTLRADILSVEQPMFGLDLKVLMEVRYNLIDARGRVRFDRTIRSEYTAGVSDEFVAVTRLKIANEGAARANIANLLQVLGAQVSSSSVGAVS